MAIGFSHEPMWFFPLRFRVGFSDLLFGSKAGSPSKPETYTSCPKPKRSLDVESSRLFLNVMGYHSNYSGGPGKVHGIDGMRVAYFMPRGEVLKLTSHRQGRVKWLSLLYLTITAQVY